MKRQAVLIDTGPIVAVLSEKDEHHDRCTAQLESLQAPLLTCWPVVTEVLWLLRRDGTAVQGVWRAFDAGLLALLPVDETAMPWLAKFLARYENLTPDLADAMLVYLAERESISTIFTLVRRDFSVYRFGKNRHLTVLPGTEP